MKSNLYTRTGDDGTTSLVGGERVKKNSARLEAYGSLDELSSDLGVIAASKETSDEVRGQIKEIQNELFNLGAYLATSVPEGSHPLCPSLGDGSRLRDLESWIDTLDEQTPKINAFILPGGSVLAAHIHRARTACRRCERRLIDLADLEWIDPAVIAYINRLSDYLFIAAKFSNFMQGVEEQTWKQG